jgi:hypothetical protein
VLSRRAVIHVVLSLLLLLSQQMAISHVMSHWTDGRGTTAQLSPDGSRKVAEPLASDKHCQQCLAFAQIASAVGNPPQTLAAIGGADGCTLAPAVAPLCRQAIAAFRARAPPQA